MSATLERLALAVQLPAFAGTTLPIGYADLLADGLGGVCYFASNTSDGPATVAELSSAIRAANPQAVIAVDEEGGDVTRLHAANGSPVLGHAALGAADDLDLTRATGRAIGAQLAAVGVNLDLGPVCDVNTNVDNPVIGTRIFGATSERVAAHVTAWVAGLQEAGVAACGKHFPGHGSTAQDSHLALPVIDVDVDTLATRELGPFRAAVEAGIASVMTSHIVVSAIDPDLPATLSKPVLSLLRDQMSYDRVIVSDALDMAGVSAGRGIPEAAVLSLAAGADLLCLGAEKEVALVRETQAAIIEAVRSGRLARTRLVEAVARIERMLQDLAVLSPNAVDDDCQLDGARRATAVDGVLPNLRGAVVVSVETAANIAVGEVPWGLTPDLAVRPGAAWANDRPVILQVRDAHRRPEIDVRGAAVVVEWGWPGPWDGSVPRICTRGYSRPGAAVVSELLRKSGWDR